MHEISLVRDMLDQIRKIAAQQSIDAITEIQIEIGPLSGVEPLLIEQAYAQLVSETSFASTRLSIVFTSLNAVCLDCQTNFEVFEFEFCCPECRSHRIQIVSGDEVKLIHIKHRTAVSTS